MELIFNILDIVAKRPSEFFVWNACEIHKTSICSLPEFHKKMIQNAPKPLEIKYFPMKCKLPMKYLQAIWNEIYVNKTSVHRQIGEDFLFQDRSVKNLS